jgi:hypothetical protein
MKSAKKENSSIFRNSIFEERKHEGRKPAKTRVYAQKPRLIKAVHECHLWFTNWILIRMVKKCWILIVLITQDNIRAGKS